MTNTIAPAEAGPHAMTFDGRRPVIETNDDTFWRAVLARDARSDGRFVYAVKSTGVYCRPSCPSRRPKRESVQFFRGPDSASAAAAIRALARRPRRASITCGKRRASSRRTLMNPSRWRRLPRTSAPVRFISSGPFPGSSASRRASIRTRSVRSGFAAICGPGNRSPARCTTPVMDRAAACTSSRRQDAG